MEEIAIKIGGTEMEIPVGDRLQAMLGETYRRLNYKRRIAQMRHANLGEPDTPYIVMDSEFVFALEDTFDEEGYGDVFHRQFEKLDLDARRILYALFREDRTIRYLVTVQGNERGKVEKAVRLLFARLSEEVK